MPSLALMAKLGGKPLTGSIGVQVVHTKQSSDGSISNFRVVGGTGVVSVVPATGGSSYTNFLPSATMSVELADGFYYKLGASHTMVRPRLDQERVNQEFGIDITRLGSTIPGQSVFSSSGGNPNLRPYESTNVDMSFEKYFAESGYIAFSGYFKKLTKFVDPEQQLHLRLLGCLIEPQPRRTRSCRYNARCIPRACQHRQGPSAWR